VDYLSRIIVCVKGFHAYKIFHSKPILPLPLKYVTCSSTLNKNKKKKIKESPTSSVIYTKSTDLQKKMNFTITAQLVSATRQHAVSHPS
jgi:predicted solute-binding protein